jgi:hypothetical protein
MIVAFYDQKFSHYQNNIDPSPKVRGDTDHLYPSKNRVLSKPGVGPFRDEEIYQKELWTRWPRTHHLLSRLRRWHLLLPLANGCEFEGCMPATVAVDYLGDPEIAKTVRRRLEEFMQRYQGQWNIRLLGSQRNTIWEMTVENPEGKKSMANKLSRAEWRNPHLRDDEVEIAQGAASGSWRAAPELWPCR